MKKLFFLTALLVSCVFGAYANVACPTPATVQQPDGTSLTLVNHGDEFVNYTTTLDGYTVVRGADHVGYYYARLVDGQLVATELLAHEAAARSSREVTLLSDMPLYQHEDDDFVLRQCRNAMPTLVKAMAQPGMPLDPETPGVGEGVDFEMLKNFRGLIILVNFNDREMRLGNQAKEVMTQMVNAEHYTGYTDPKLGRQNYTGSVRDYFRDNTVGKFAPQFDVVGPVTVNRSQYYINGTKNSGQLAYEVLQAADPYVDYSQYDSNNDGMVDMFYIIYAGIGANYSGNDSRVVWPHASSLAYYGNSISALDGKKFGSFACSCELYGNTSYLEGIGTIVHEFSHVIGYPDFYDVNYGGHEHPDSWDVMSGGSYFNAGRTPVAYTAFERYAGGFLRPDIINADSIGATIELPALNTSNKAYMMLSKQKDEYFMIENRQKSGWDSYLPGHGMLVWRVDSTKTWIWKSNLCNATDQLCMRLVRAKGCKFSNGNVISSESDPFPGSGRVTMLGNTESASANLLTYRGYESPLVFKRISEESGIIRFQVEASQRDLPEGTIFYESFDDCNGTGGNDGVFSSSMKVGTFMADNDGWNYNTANGCKECVRFGGSLQPGYGTTPTIKLEKGIIYEVTFMVGSYYRDDPSLKVEVSEGTAKLYDPQEPGEGTSVTLQTPVNVFGSASLHLEGEGNVRLTFRGGSNKAYRFLLDEIEVRKYAEVGIQSVTMDGAADASVRYNLSGQRVDAAYRGLSVDAATRRIVVRQ